MKTTFKKELDPATIAVQFAIKRMKTKTVESMAIIKYLTK